MKTRGLICSVIISLTLGSASAWAFDLQGHRGARGVMPENTIPAFAYALSTGVSTLELDLAVTQDGTVIVSHNPNPSSALVRTGKGEWVAPDAPAFFTMPLSEVQTFDVGTLNPNSRYASRYPKQKQLDGVKIPTLADVFALAAKAGNKDVRFNIETKLHPGKPDLTPAPDDFAEAVLAVVKAHGLEERVTIQSFDWRTLMDVQKKAPGVTTAYLTAQQKWLDNVERGKPGASPWTGGLDADDFPTTADMIAKAGGKVWSPYHMDISQDDIAKAQKLGLKVKVWTVNDPARMAELIDMGVDGIITDDPATLRQVMADNGLALPVATPVSP